MQLRPFPHLSRQTKKRMDGWSCSLRLRHILAMAACMFLEVNLLQSYLTLQVQPEYHTSKLGTLLPEKFVLTVEFFIGHKIG